MCNFLLRCLQGNSVVAWYLIKVKEDWAWLEKYLAECDPALHRITDNPNDDILSIFMKLKSFWYATRHKEVIITGREEGAAASVENVGVSPMAVFKTEWNEELDALPRRFDKIQLIDPWGNLGNTVFRPCLSSE